MTRPTNERRPMMMTAGRGANAHLDEGRRSRNPPFPKETLKKITRTHARKRTPFATEARGYEPVSRPRARKSIIVVFFESRPPRLGANFGGAARSRGSGRWFRDKRSIDRSFRPRKKKRDSDHARDRIVRFGGASSSAQWQKRTKKPMRIDLPVGRVVVSGISSSARFEQRPTASRTRIVMPLRGSRYRPTSSPSDPVGRAGKKNETEVFSKRRSL
mmetsp:Transcript_18104/g.41722  ORF Transcript_18104/g.41722 Transcript_18104/m.41722 type:complete len:216 (+) Transcript_18104:90-737(+)